MGSLANLRINTLLGGGVVRPKVSAEHVHAAPSHHQLEAGNIRAVLMMGLHCKARQLLVEGRLAPMVVAQRI